MKLNQNSISARMYRWFYLTYDMPQNLCPYFWKLVIMWVLIIPYGLISLPVIIIKQEPDEWGIRPLFGAFLYLFLFVIFIALFPLTYFFWGWFDHNSTFGKWQVGGILIWAVVLMCTAVWGVIMIIDKRKRIKRHRQTMYIWTDEGDYVTNPDYVLYEDKPNIISEFIKAKYNKYCPKIEWKE